MRFVPRNGPLPSRISLAEGEVSTPSPTPWRRLRRREGAFPAGRHGIELRPQSRHEPSNAVACRSKSTALSDSPRSISDASQDIGHRRKLDSLAGSAFPMAGRATTDQRPVARHALSCGRPRRRTIAAAFIDNWLETRTELLHGDLLSKLETAGDHTCQIFSSAGEGSTPPDAAHFDRRRAAVHPHRPCLFRPGRPLPPHPHRSAPSRRASGNHHPDLTSMRKPCVRW